MYLTTGFQNIELLDSGATETHLWTWPAAQATPWPCLAYSVHFLRLDTKVS